MTYEYEHGRSLGGFIYRKVMGGRYLDMVVICVEESSARLWFGRARTALVLSISSTF
jgi:hypothetical protein